MMRIKVSYLAFFAVFAMFINAALVQTPEWVTYRSSSILSDDSAKPRSHDVQPEYYFDRSYLRQLLMPNLLSNKTTASIYPNINITRDTFPQNEPSVKVSRKNPNIVVAAWRDFRTGVNPAIRRVGFSRSTDGGTTWDSCKLLPPFDLMHPRASDPAVCTDTSGNFYISTISLNNSNWDGIVVVYKSSNEGLSFDYSWSIAPHSDTTQFDDKEYITCDLVPGSPYKNNIYVAWAGYDARTVCRSTDGGFSWSERIKLPQTGGGTGLIPVVGAGGEVYIIWMGQVLTFGQTPGIYFNRSTNGGLNFSNDMVIDTISYTSFMRLPSMAVDITNGQRHGYIYAVWANDVVPYSGDEDVFFKYSSDRGSTWSARKRVNDDPLGNGKRQYWPWITVNEQGDIFIIYFDSRNTPLPETVEAYLAYSTNGGVSFINEVLSSQQFSTNAPNIEVRFGDYIGIDSHGGRIMPVWTDQRTGGFNQEIYTAIIVDSLIGIKPIANTVPKQFNLYQNYPNPFNPSTTIKFEIPKQSNVTLEIFDVLGREVRTLVNETLRSGTYERTWNAGGISSGVYFYRLQTQDFAETKKMVLIK